MPRYKVQWKGWPTKYNLWLFTGEIDQHITQHFRLHGSNTATFQEEITTNPDITEVADKELLTYVIRKAEEVYKGQFNSRHPSHNML